MPENESTETAKRSPPFTEKFKNMCIGLGALTGLVLGLMANLRGEPVAEKTWSTLREQVNQQADVVNDLQTKMVVLQAHEEGRAAATLQLKLDTLQKELDKLHQQLKSPAPISSSTSMPLLTCPAGQLQGSDGKCVAVPRTIVRKAVEDAAIANRALLEEQKQRKELEKKKLELQKQLQDVKKIEQSPTLQRLPTKLDDAENM